MQSASMAGRGWGAGAETLRFTFTWDLENKAILKDKAGRGNSIVEVSCVLWRAGRIHGLQERPTLLFKASIMAIVFPNKM